MRRISKGKEPASLVEFRAAPGADWDDYPDKQGAREALCREQGRLCCFCQQRIRPERTSMKIAHFVPRRGSEGDRELELQWSNLFGACRGGEGNERSDQHCDTRQSSARLHARLNPITFVPGTLRYHPSGRISADDPDVAADIEEKLNLNLEKLQRNRRTALSALKQQLGKGQWSRAELERRIWRLSEGSAAELVEHCDFLLWYLKISCADEHHRRCPLSNSRIFMPWSECCRSVRRSRLNCNKPSAERRTSRRRTKTRRAGPVSPNRRRVGTRRPWQG